MSGIYKQKDKIKTMESFLIIKLKSASSVAVIVNYRKALFLGFRFRVSNFTLLGNGFRTVALNVFLF